VLLIGGGVLLYRYDAGRGVPRRPPVRTERHASRGAAPHVRRAAARSSRVSPPRERSPLGWLGLGIALLVVGIAAILQNLGALEIRLVRYPALVC
jgi:hypothetical protein